MRVQKKQGGQRQSHHAQSAARSRFVAASAASVDLVVLDLTDEKVRSHLGVTEQDVVSDDYAVTQAIGVAARNARFDAVLAPAAALPGCKTLVVCLQNNRLVLR